MYHYTLFALQRYSSFIELFAYAANCVSIKKCRNDKPGALEFRLIYADSRKIILRCQAWPKSTGRRKVSEIIFMDLLCEIFLKLMLYHILNYHICLFSLIKAHFSNWKEKSIRCQSVWKNELIRLLIKLKSYWYLNEAFWWEHDKKIVDILP